ncbi:hypothetical protein CBS101457_002256 [Exobasidium rhododendri]|nr:hypothetical protein CBS101457_002256 [Exobasidium rhododendri]
MSVVHPSYAPPRLPILRLAGELPVLKTAVVGDVQSSVTAAVEKWNNGWNELTELYRQASPSSSSDQQSVDRQNKVKELFLEDGFYKDHLALSSTLRAFHGPARIHKFLEARVKIAKPGKSTLWGALGPPTLTKITDHLLWITAFLEFPIEGLHHGKEATGTAMLVLAPTTSLEAGTLEWKAWSFCSSVETFTGFPQLSLSEMCDQEPNADLRHHSARSYLNSLDEKKAASPLILDVCIVGGGQAGLSVAGNLKQVGVERTLVVERFAKAGGTWANRYEGLKLHTIKHYCESQSLPLFGLDPLRSGH